MIPRGVFIARHADEWIEMKFATDSSPVTVIRYELTKIDPHIQLRR